MNIRRIKLKFITVSLVVGLASAPVLARRAHAYAGGEGALAAGIIMLWITYVTAKGLICTPVAAINASKHEAGFHAAFKACWDWQPDRSLAAQAQATDGSNDAPTVNPQADEAEPVHFESIGLINQREDGK